MINIIIIFCIIVIVIIELISDEWVKFFAANCCVMK